MPRSSWLAFALVIALTACGGAAPAPVSNAPGTALQVTSSAFAPGAPIPQKYTCDGQDLSPPLAWSEPPAGTQSLALIADDPDAPGGTWVHWLVYNLPASARSLPEGAPAADQVAGGGAQGANSWKRPGYGGPCPPKGSEHRYSFKVYALDAVLALEPGAGKKDLEKAMEGHVLAQGQLTGLYAR